MSVSRRILCALVVLGAGIAVCHSAYGEDKKVSYHGLIRENAKEGDEVELDNPLMVTNKGQLMGNEICGYTLYKSYSELPFKVELLDRKDGSARILLAKGYSLNYERRYRYSFDIAAHDCSTGVHAEREKVYIEVEDINEYVPHWKEQMYFAEVEEGRYFDQIVKVEAVDDDGSEKFSLICDYHIETQKVPFQIDAHGYLQNTEPLDYSQRHNYILEARAVDCGGLMSEKIMINIAVKESCKLGWKTIPDLVQFIPGSGALKLAEKGSLDLCGTPCDKPLISATVLLETGQQKQVCDKDTYSIQAQRRMCGSAPETVDLLPNPTLSSFDKLPTSNQNVDQTFSFDGSSNAIEVDSKKVDAALEDGFSISTWMAHEGSEEDEKHTGNKQHILCYSDGQYHNRHHYSVFVHNCHLVLLMRREPAEGIDLNQFMPAEWRWQAPEVCDGLWHHYTINMDFPEAHLYIDGHRTVEKEKNPVIVDDWPLHPSKKVQTRKLIVGACWHGGDQEMAQYFHGQLAGMTLLKGQSESDRVIQCLSDCQEKIDFHDMADLETGMSVSLNSEMTHITFNGHNKSRIETLIQHVGYRNSRVYPTPGDRKLLMTTRVQCADKAAISIPDVQMTVKVAQPERPTMRLSGTERVSYSETLIPRGVSMLADLTISSNSKDKSEDEVEIQPTAETEDSDVLMYQLDSCVVRPDPVLDMKKEQLSYPTNMVTSLGLEVSSSEDGLIIAGADVVKHYQTILRAVHYSHSTPQAFNTRHFIVSCTELNGRFVSNDFEVQVDVIHKQPEKARQPVAHVQANVAYQHVAEVHIQDTPMKAAQSLNGFNAGAASGAAAGTGVGMIVIIVVCVGFLMFMIVLGVMRIRSAQQRREVTVEDRPEMEWDNSALTITVNPMENETTYDEEQEGATDLAMAAGGDTDSEDDDVSLTHEDEAESSEDEGAPHGVKVVKDGGLEWDDSTLTF